MRRGTKGFTLIELLVVVAIIGILAAIALPKLFSAICTAKVGQVDGILGSVNGALSMYFADYTGNYPKTAGAAVGTYIVTTYMSTAPKSPWGTDYIYAGDGTVYSVCVSIDATKGCDGVPASGGDGYRYYSSSLGKVTQQDANPCP